MSGHRRIKNRVQGRSFFSLFLQLLHQKGSRNPLVVMGEDSCSKDHEFEYRCHILYGHLFFFTLICCKSCIVCLKRPKINKKEARVGPFFQIKQVRGWGRHCSVIRLRLPFCSPRFVGSNPKRSICDQKGGRTGKTIHAYNHLTKEKSVENKHKRGQERRN